MTEISRTLEMEGTSRWDSIKYLEIPLVKAAPRKSLWMPLMDKLKRKIMSWGASWLNKASKIVLINYVLTSLLVYQASIILAPKGIVQEIDNLMRKFLWEGARNEGRKENALSKLEQNQSSKMGKRAANQRCGHSESSHGRKDSLENDKGKNHLELQSSKNKVLQRSQRKVPGPPPKD